MDETDLKIIEILKQNGRISMRELGASIAMSNTAVTERVRKLEDAGIIRGYRAVIDEKMCGNTVHAYMLIEFTHTVRERPEKFLRAIEANAHIACVTPIFTGGMDYLMEIYCNNMTQLERIVYDMVPFGLTSTYIAGETNSD